MRRSALLLGVVAGLSGMAQQAREKAKKPEAPQSFFRAEPDPLRGDWQGRGGYVAQVIRIDDKRMWGVTPPPEPNEFGKYQANIFRAFDVANNKPVAVLVGVRNGGAVVFSGSGWTGSIEAGKFRARKGDAWFDLERVTRTPATLGMKPPPGAVVLFDGSGQESWAKMKAKSWLIEDGPAQWKLLQDGVLEVVPQAGSLISRRWFGDMRLHLEFRTLGGPTNSGVYLQDRYEININESYGRLDGNPCAGFDNCTGVKPAIRCSRPPLEWQTLDVDFRAPRFDAAGRKTASARATVWYNGTVLYQDQELGPLVQAAARLGEAPTGPLQLQEHGTPVQFRNIWVVEGK